MPQTTAQLVEREKRKKFVDDYKKDHPCVVCRYNKCTAAMEFHHLNNGDKILGIADSYRNWSIPRIQIEIDKCAVLCSNCHRELHVEESITEKSFPMPCGCV